MMDNAEPHADVEYVEFPEYCPVTQLQSELANKNERIAVLTQSVDQPDAQKVELLAEGWEMENLSCSSPKLL